MVKASDFFGGDYMKAGHFTKPKLLVIDEAHERAETAWEQRSLTDIIDRRYRTRLDTIIITNETADACERSLGDSIADRMVETGWMLNFDGPSYRQRRSR